MVKTVDLHDGEVIVSQAEINELIRQRDEAVNKHNTAISDTNRAKTESNNNKVLINQCVSVVNQVKKIFPGITEGNFFASFNPMLLMGNKELEKLGPSFQQLEKLINEYSKTNAIPIKP